MPVCQEPVRQYFAAPTRQTVWDELATANDSPIITAQKATITLYGILKTLAQVVQNVENLPDAAADDANDLIHLACYFLYVPLLKAYNISSLRANGADSTVRFRKWLDKVYYLMIEVDLLVRARVADTKKKEHLDAMYTQAKDVNNTTIPNVPALGIIELLLRVITQCGTFHNLDNIRDEFQRIDFGVDPSHLAGIPSVAFICMQYPVVGADPTFVITTSSDRWAQFDTIDKFSMKARTNRLRASPFLLNQAASPDIARIKKWSNDLSRRLHTLSNDDLVNNPLGYFDHTQQIGEPLSCPGFFTMARCLRCQALFRYSVSRACDYQDRDYRDRNDSKVNVYLNCAEAYAHFYCNQLV